jgi:prepilin-type N-terminal cleavage/methylation domain-containing protein
MKLFCNKKGFSLTELLIAMAIFGILMAVAGSAFNRMLADSAKQTRTAESNIEGVLGLEMMRGQLNSAGFGLPWSFANAITYQECSVLPGSAFNQESMVPRALMSGNDLPLSADATVRLNRADVLVVRSQSIGDNDACKRWSYVNSNGAPNTSSLAGDNLQPTDRVIAVKPGFDSRIGVATNELVMNGGTFFTTFNNYSVNGFKPYSVRPGDPPTTHLLYGVSDTVNLRMPFNRADFFVRRPAASEDKATQLPARCNPGTGILVKGTVSQSDGTYIKTPLLDCVADMQVVFGVKDVVNGTITDTNSISGLSAQQIREQVREIKIYLLAHEGGKDMNYTYPQSTIGVGPGDGLISGLGSTFNFADNHDHENLPDWSHYRWKVYRLIVKPKNLSSVQQN